MNQEQQELRYAGFWIRSIATLIDSLLCAIILAPLLIAIYGDEFLESDKLVLGLWDFLLTWVMPFIAVVLFWRYKSATPGKMALGIRIVDARTGGTLTIGQSVGRYLGYFVSIIPLCLGFVWVAFDKRKQGWHDKLATTVVVRYKSGTEPVSFEAGT
jgi:uncharacterized RDD family membrane protein YckC